MWSRFLPTNIEMKRVLDEGVIGEVKYAEFAIGWQAPNGPRSRFYEKELGGGAAYDLLVYCYELADFYLGKPEKVENVSVRWTDTGVDETETVTLRYPGCLCTLSASLAVNLPERAVLHGTKGTLYRDAFGMYLYMEKVSDEPMFEGMNQQHIRVHIPVTNKGHNTLAWKDRLEQSIARLVALEEHLRTKAYAPKIAL
jgi:predicted dehydrogenase